MLKPPRNFKKMLILPCLCSITFYLGSQMMTYTEAAFVHETKVTATISTASIFPKTVDQLTEQAKQHKEVILHEYKEMKSKVTVTSVQELEQALVTWKQGREKIVAERESLQKVYNSIEEPYNQVQEELKGNTIESNKQVFSYVNAGFHIVKENCEYVDKEVNLQVIDKQIQDFEKLLVDETTKQVSESKKQEEAKKLEESKKQEEAKKLEESKKQEEVKKLEESKKQEEAKKLEEGKKQEEAKKLEESKKQEETKKLEESKKQEEAKKLEESKKQEEQKNKDSK
ncbi:DUF4047 domain-containing protein [Bacillus sp. MHSD_36]|uniref:DUF4047 domain-containing protein n=1 Tax=unclassified Bacillus (in: firmicutes) TaxID=185979 RepID=UPI002740A93F|nr:MULTISPECIES: DUF4047 domain-containing protein [unclassified Bacillus (in: firmicutes)]MDP7990873.1 DUF4047 domain-containing protein [Bacillus sp. MHSD_36]MDR4979747.1 DUF4047 domain-containing protein [Bacillus sp. MHSD_37]